MSVDVEQLASAIYAERVRRSVSARTHAMVGWSDLSSSVRAADEAEAAALIASVPAPVAGDIAALVAYYFMDRLVGMADLLNG